MKAQEIRYNEIERKDGQIDSIGRNIRDIRKNCKPEAFTVRYIVSQINKYLPPENAISQSLYYKWENEERMPTAKQIPAIAKALEVSENALFHWNQRRNLSGEQKWNALYDELMSIPEKKLEKFAWIALNWNGDKTALLEFAMLYAALSQGDRRDILSFSMRIYQLAKKEGRLADREQEPDMEYLRDVLSKLWK